jgi:hypothetical protein
MYSAYQKYAPKTQALNYVEWLWYQLNWEEGTNGARGRGKRNRGEGNIFLFVT